MAYKIGFNMPFAFSYENLICVIQFIKKIFALLQLLQAGWQSNDLLYKGYFVFISQFVVDAGEFSVEDVQKIIFIDL